MITTYATTSKKANERERRNRVLAYKAAMEGIVLLENDGVLPIKPGRIALFGAGARYTIKGGSGSGEVNVRHVTSAEEGLKKAGFTIATEGWLNRYDEAWESGWEEFIRNIRKGMRDLRPGSLEKLLSAEYRYPGGDRIREQEIRESGTDTCIYIVARQSGEGLDRKDEAGSFRLEEAEVANIRLCAKEYEKFILAINTGAPIDLTPLDEITGINAVVYMGQLGMEGGSALAAVLSGKVGPSGKLAVTWPKSYADVPFGAEFGKKNEVHAEYKEGIYVGYRYYDTFGVEPRYPFGFGLSYTKFERGPAAVSLDGEAVICEVPVTNVGDAPGREIIQVYASCPRDGIEKEYQKLAAFAKTRTLQPGESETLKIIFPVTLLSSYDEELAETILDAGDYLIRVGSSSRETEVAGILRLAVKIVISMHRNLCAPDWEIVELHAKARKEAEASGNTEIPVLDFDCSLIKTKRFSYRGYEEKFREETERLVDTFAIEDMAKFCAGTGLFGQKNGFSCPGAVGHTTSDYLDRGIPNVEMCDGPAGLRLQRRSTRTKNGKIKALDTPISIYEYLPDTVRKLLLGNPKKEEVLYQFVTGFPAAAMVAQSWNTGLVYEIGKAVSAEMTEFGVGIWLAPGMNIVRNPLCGRNFEYYSEDPVLSGKLAAALTVGVQETPGNYVTIKHFAANNQEENRYFVSSDVDERVLREIYLRGFEIAVKESRPRFVMTAYNKINGEYCANRKELCTDILRKEWGFKGAVMTDWLSTGKDRADELAAIAAGVDMIMPGGRGVVRMLEKGAWKGELAFADLKKSCLRVVDSIR